MFSGLRGAPQGRSHVGRPGQGGSCVTWARREEKGLGKSKWTMSEIVRVIVWKWQLVYRNSIGQNWPKKLTARHGPAQIFSLYIYIYRETVKFELCKVPNPAHPWRSLDSASATAWCAVVSADCSAEMSPAWRNHLFRMEDGGRMWKVYNIPPVNNS